MWTARFLLCQLHKYSLYPKFLNHIRIQKYMSRIIEPPRDQLDHLPTALTPGEQEVLNLFDTQLPDEWEIYIQPHLNGLRPDFVLLHPNVGIAVFEIKDWNLNAISYWVEPDPATGQPRLKARNSDGRTFSPENPVDRIRLYKSEIHSLYCPRLEGKGGFATITAGLIFTRTARAQVKEKFDPLLDKGMHEYPQYYPLSGADDLAMHDLKTIFPEFDRGSSYFMSEDLAEDVRGWLREPAFSQEQRQPLEMDSRQHDLATTRTVTGYRRIKGPAGSGKSMVLAARAAELEAESQEVLVASFNITLMNYLRDLAARHRRDLDSRTTGDRRKRSITFLHFHSWCARVCKLSGHEKQYSELWRETDKDTVLDQRLPELVQQIYDEAEDRCNLPEYNAILVDEGQDYRPLWWDTLRRAVKPDGERMLVADKTQNIYGTARAWTEQAMGNAGFRGPWVELHNSYRLAPDAIPLLQKFADTFLSTEEVDIPQVPQDELPRLYPVTLRWVQASPDAALQTCVQEMQHQMQHLHSDTALADIIFLSGKEIGRRLVTAFEGRGIDILHTFAEDDAEGQRQKLAFFQGSAQVKATTLHSYKGWEARHLIVYVGSIKRPEDPALLYTALTRLKRHEKGSTLTVVSSAPELRAFGQSWPDFRDAGGDEGHAPLSPMPGPSPSEPAENAGEGSRDLSPNNVDIMDENGVQLGPEQDEEPVSSLSEKEENPVPQEAGAEDRPEAQTEPDASEAAAAGDARAIIALKANTIVQGTVLEKSNRRLVLDIGTRCVIKGTEIRRLGRSFGRIEVGQSIEVFVFPADDSGEPKVSILRAWEDRDWQRAESLRKSGEIVSSRVTHCNQHGIRVAMGILRGFVPSYHLGPEKRKLWNREKEAGEHFRSLQGQILQLQVIKVDSLHNRLLLSEKKVADERRNAILAELEEGDIREGVVSHLAAFGAFVDIGGIDGLLHIAQLSWSAVSSPSEVLQAGQKITVKVISIDRERRQVGLSLKQLQTPPWVTLAEHCQEGDLVEVEVTNLTPAGAFVQLVDKPVGGLLHLSELSWTKINHPSEVLQVGQRIKVKVILTRKHKRMGLSLRWLQPHPWDTLAERCREGDLVEVVITNLVDFGAFAQLLGDEAIEGLIHISEMSHEPIERPDQVVAVGERHEVRIIRVDTRNRRLGFSIKQAGLDWAIAPEEDM